MSKKGEVHYNKEYKRVTKDGYKYVYGTTNRFTCNSLYLYFKPGLRVNEKIAVTKLEHIIHDELISEMNKMVSSTSGLSSSFISDFQFSNQILRPGVRSKIQYELFLSTLSKFKTPEDYEDMMERFVKKVIDTIEKHIESFGKMTD